MSQAKNRLAEDKKGKRAHSNKNHDQNLQHSERMHPKNYNEKDICCGDNDASPDWNMEQ